MLKSHPSSPVPSRPCPAPSCLPYAPTPSRSSAHLVHGSEDARRGDALLVEQVVQVLYVVPRGCKQDCRLVRLDHLAHQIYQGAQLLLGPEARQGG